jgi:hypothetical protein
MFEGLFILGLLVIAILTCLRCVRLECRALKAETEIVDLQIKVEELQAAQPSREALIVLGLLVGTCEADGPFRTPNGSPFWRKAPVEVFVRDSEMNLKRIS